jgi:hypothetical protein
MSSQKDFIHPNTLQTQISGLSVMYPIRDDNINIYTQYNMFVKQRMNKKQACDHLKIRPGTIDRIRKSNYKVLITLYKEKNLKRKIIQKIVKL